MLKIVFGYFEFQLYGINDFGNFCHGFVEKYKSFMIIPITIRNE